MMQWKKSLFCILAIISVLTVMADAGAPQIGQSTKRVCAKGKCIPRAGLGDDACQSNFQCISGSQKTVTGSVRSLLLGYMPGVLTDYGIIGDTTSIVGSPRRYAPGMADLIVEDIWWVPKNPTKYDTIQIYSRVRNIGGAPSSSWMAEVSIDGQVKVSNNEYPGLESGGGWVVVADVRRFPVGEHSIRVRLDPENQVPELNKSNNELVKTFNVTLYSSVSCIVKGNFTFNPRAKCCRGLYMKQDFKESRVYTCCQENECALDMICLPKDWSSDTLNVTCKDGRWVKFAA